jgi:hypothetical protein
MNSILVKEQNQFAHMTRFEVRPTVQLRSRIETADRRFGSSIGKNACLKSSAATRGTVSFARRRDYKLRLKLDCELHHRMSNLVSHGVIHLRRGEDPAEPRQPTQETRAGALARPARAVDGAVDNRPKRFRFRHFKVVDLHLGKIGVKLILAVAGNDAVVERLGIGEEFALIAIGRQIPCVEHNLDDLADPACLVSQGALLSSPESPNGGQQWRTCRKRQIPPLASLRDDQLQSLTVRRQRGTPRLGGSVRESLWRDRAIADFRHAYLLKSESKTLAHFSAYRKEKILFLFSGPRP